MSAPHSMLHFISAGDHKLMRKVNKWPAPRWVRLAAIAATRAGDGWLWYLLGLLVILFGGENRLTATAAAGSAAATGVGLFISLKKVSGRKRPCEIEPHVWARLLPPDQFSFPSGHTITAFAVAVSIGEFYPVLLGILLFCALAVATSRILLGMHFLSDVVVGAMIGSGLAVTSHSMFS
ncbi:MAG: phosphoesterase, PA-phosphatase related [Bryobacterales bacterium]|jgi:undecaprenyl-diphosphatase|nr:phosphoesterase, PA-phosphatase related [Bryobacterales bacterium]